MNNATLKALYVLLLSLGLAFVFNFLFFGKLIGISIFVFVVVLLAVVFVFGKYNNVSAKKSWWLVALIAFFALMPAIRANEFLTFLNVAATFGLLMLLAHQLAGTPAFVMKIVDYIKLAVVVPFQMLSRALSTVTLASQVHSSVKRRDVWVRVLKGVLMALPLLIVFSLLFAQADLAFSQFLNGFININISERTAQYIALLIFTFVLGLSYLSYIFFVKPAKAAAPTAELTPGAEGTSLRHSLGDGGKSVETLVFLSLISCLFLLFIGFQVAYLFGGQANIIATSFTYAEYARRGFWELLIVALLSLVVLLAAEHHTGTEGKRNWSFLAPALVLIAEVVVIIFSAFTRLSLYVDAYGQSLQRFYAAGFILLLLALFILLTIKLIKSKPENFFAFGTLITALTFLLIVNILNPDAHVVAYNTERYTQTGKIDALYLARLSADAVPGKIKLYNKLEGDDKVTMHDYLKTDKHNLETWSTHWQASNYSRSRALKLLEEF